MPRDRVDGSDYVSRRAHEVFVYGTLLPGGRNSAVAHRAGLVAVTPATVYGFRLYHLEPEGYPVAVRGPGVLHGSVLSLAGSLDELDELEGVDLQPPLYRRIRCGPDGRGEAWIYSFARSDRLFGAGVTWIPDGRWTPP